MKSTLEELNTVYNAFITFKEIKGKEKGPLQGLTFGIKDNIITKGVKTTAGSRILQENIPSENAWIVDRILEAGGTIIGKTNMHEFAIGATNTSSIVGPARNPYDKDRIAGGSSGGSAVAVALNMVDVGIGTDTGGSVRIPAALCGVIGFKLTTGLLPMDGIIPFSWTLDSLGIITRDFETLKKVLNSIIPTENKRVLLTTAKVKPKLGMFLFGDDPTSKALKSIINKLSSYFDIVEVNLKFMQAFGANARSTIAIAEGAAYHRSWIEANSSLYFPDVRDILMDGLKVRAIEYIDALRIRRVIFEEYVRIFNEIDAIISPTTKIPAPKISDVIGKEKEYRKLLVSNTELFNLVNAPSITIPATKIDNLPVGLMISGLPHEDGKVIDIAQKIFEILTNGSSN